VQSGLTGVVEMTGFAGVTPGLTAGLTTGLTTGFGGGT
tara:strand:+ start:125 stop:238 length:114 start_codon:yes stop_codon:yes gene_type:complete